MASRVLGEWYFDEPYATCMLEMAVDVLNMDETFQNKMLKVHTRDLYVVDMNERVGDVTGEDEGSCQVVLCKYRSRHIASKGISNERFFEKQDTSKRNENTVDAIVYARAIYRQCGRHCH